jgi:hypothetical protein
VFCGESAGPAYELGLAGPVAFVDMAAAGATLAGVGSVHVDERHSSPGCSSPGCFVGQKRAELGEGPAGVCGTLGLAEPYPFADTSQFFDCYPASGAFSLGHDPRGYLVIDIGSEPCLPVGALPQQPFRRFGVFLLELLS